MKRYPAPCLALLFICLSVANSKAADKDDSLLSIAKIYKSGDFGAKSYSARWLDDETAAYTTLENSAEESSGRDIVVHDAKTGAKQVLVSASLLVPPGSSAPLKIENYAWSSDHNLLLIYTNSQRVWRQNTRGDYWVLDISARQLTKLGGDIEPSTMMFAKLSPNGEHVAYVHQRNIYVQDLHDGAITQLTSAPSDDIINGTTDWVYEEEFGLRDGFRWSPDSQSIAYWQIDTSGVHRFPLVNNTDTLYPRSPGLPIQKWAKRTPAAELASCRFGRKRHAGSASLGIHANITSQEFASFPTRASWRSSN